MLLTALYNKGPYLRQRWLQGELVNKEQPKKKNYHYCIVPLPHLSRLVDTVIGGFWCLQGGFLAWGDKGRFARAITVQCTGRNFIFTSDRQKSRPYRGLNSGHTKHEPDVLTPPPPASLTKWRKRANKQRK
ncbi:hypothetical protein BsWGS_09567 [Bradybaena similaris]